MYVIEGVSKFYEQDDYNEGCLPDTGGIHDIDVAFSGYSVIECLNEFKEFVSHELTDDAVQLNACGDTGRVDIAVLENDEGYPANVLEITRWKHGKQDLYYCVYTGYMVEKLDELIDFDKVTL